MLQKTTTLWKERVIADGGAYDNNKENFQYLFLDKNIEAAAIKVRKNASTYVWQIDSRLLFKKVAVYWSS
jgi:hypothetical protein